MSRMDAFLNHPLLWGIVTLIALAIALSGKLDVGAAQLLLVVVGGLTLVGVYRFTPVNSLPVIPAALVMMMVCGSTGLILYGLSEWMSSKPSITAAAPPESKAPPEPPSQRPETTPMEPARPTHIVTQAPKHEYRGVTLDSTAIIGSYPPRWRIGTIDWRGLTDLRVNITNPDTEAVTGLDLFVETAPYLIYQMTQLSALSNVVFPDDPVFRDKSLTVTGFDFKKIPLDSSGPNFGSTRRRVLCERIQPGATLRVAMELATLPQGPEGAKPLPDDIRSFNVKVVGSYHVGGEPRRIDSPLVVTLGDELPNGDSVGTQKP